MQIGNIQKTSNEQLGFRSFRLDPTLAYLAYVLEDSCPYSHLYGIFPLGFVMQTNTWW